MSTPAYSSNEQIALDADVERAEVILHELAMELRLVPLAHPGLTQLHIRALALRREVARWQETQPAEALRQTTIDELLGLQERARSARETRR